MAEHQNGTERTLGMILGKLEDLGRRMDKADTSRTDLHKKIGEIMYDVVQIKSKTDTIDSRVDRVRADVDGIRPEVEILRDAKKRAAGAIVVLAAIGGTLAWLLSMLLEPVLRFFR